MFIYSSFNLYPVRLKSNREGVPKRLLLDRIMVKDISLFVNVLFHLFGCLTTQNSKTDHCLNFLPQQLTTDPFINEIWHQMLTLGQHKVPVTVFILWIQFVSRYLATSWTLTRDTWYLTWVMVTMGPGTVTSVTTTDNTGYMPTEFLCSITRKAMKLRIKILGFRKNTIIWSNKMNQLLVRRDATDILW